MTRAAWTALWITTLSMAVGQPATTGPEAGSTGATPAASGAAGTAGPGPGPAPIPHKSFRGYDCARVSEMQAVQLPAPGECPSEQITVTNSKNVTYLVLQRVNFIPVVARRCQGTVSRLPAYCGAHDHETLLTEFWQVNRRDRISQAACNRIWNNGYVSLGGTDYAIKPNTTFQRQWNQAGENFYDDPYHLRCSGEQIRVPTKNRPTQKMNYVVDGRYTTITTDVVEMALGDDGKLTAVRDRLALPCAFNQGTCQVASGTYVWDDLTEDQKCRLYQARRTTGQVHTDGSGGRTFIATDGTAMRFTIGEPVFMCGRQVYQTEHERLFLTRDLEDPLLQRPVPPAERSTLMYANVQDAYLEGKITSKLEEVIATVKMEACRMRSTHAIGRLDQIAAVQRSSTDGETAALGHGVFATATGEAWRRYRCKAVAAQAMDLPGCYTALPVLLRGSDVAAHFAAIGEEIPTQYQFYLEPHSHRVLTSAAKTPCSMEFAPLYRTIHGSWVMITPKVLLAAPPHPLADLEVFPDDDDLEKTDFAKGGLYSAKDMAEMDRFRQLPNVVRDVEVTMGGQALDQGWDRAVSQTELYPSDVLTTHGSWVWDPVGNLWAMMVKASGVGYTLFGLACGCKVVTWVLGVYWRVSAAPVHDRLTGTEHVLVSLMPSYLQRLEAQWRAQDLQAALIGRERNRRRWTRFWKRRRGRASREASGETAGPPATAFEMLDRDEPSRLRVPARKLPAPPSDGEEEPEPSVPRYAEIKPRPREPTASGKRIPELRPTYSNVNRMIRTGTEGAAGETLPRASRSRLEEGGGE